MPLSTAGLRVYPRRPYASAATSTFDYPLSSRFDESGQPHGARRRPRSPGSTSSSTGTSALVSAQFYETGAHLLANYQAPGPLPRQDGVRRRVSPSSSPTPTASRRSRRCRRSWVARSRPSARRSRHCPGRGVPARRCAAGSPCRHRGSSSPGMSLQRRWVVDLMRALRELGGGGFIAMPSAESFAAAETAEDVNRYYRSATLPARDRVRLLQLMWDLVGTEFGGRQLQYEMFYSAAQHIADLHVFRAYDWEPAGSTSGEAWKGPGNHERQAGRRHAGHRRRSAHRGRAVPTGLSAPRRDRRGGDLRRRHRGALRDDGHLDVLAVGHASVAAVVHQQGRPCARRDRRGALARRQPAVPRTAAHRAPLQSPGHRQAAAGGLAHARSDGRRDAAPAGLPRASRCEVDRSYQAYSHTIFVALIRSVWLNPIDAPPLLYHGGLYSQLESPAERAERFHWELRED